MDLTYRKGTRCIFKPIICQEGYCIDCQIVFDVGKQSQEMEEIKITRTIGKIKDKLGCDLKTACVYLQECYWCRDVVNPTRHNLVHVGGQGEVYGCDSCLGLQKVDNAY